MPVCAEKQIHSSIRNKHGKKKKKRNKNKSKPSSTKFSSANTRFEKKKSFLNAQMINTEAKESDI